jgi:uncharacterized protein YjiS (DUF1127 family)
LITSINAIRFTDSSFQPTTPPSIHPFRKHAPGIMPMSDLMMTRFRLVRPTTKQTVMRQVVPSPRMMLRTYLTRQALLELTPRQRADIDVSSSAALAEAARLPWDVNPGPRRRPAGIMGAVQRALERTRTRRLISRLATRDLRDISVSPSDAQDESAKFFWQY